MLRRIRSILTWLLVRGLLVLVLVLAVFLGTRIWEAETGAPLRAWHSFVPEELDAAAIDAADWQTWLAAEDRVMAAVRSEVTDQLEPEDRIAANRYFDGSPVYPPSLARDWNRSYILEPDGPPKGAAVFLHGLTDSPYSLRHIAKRYRDLGWATVAIRLPGHGTVPAGLYDVAWPDWSAAVRLAVREARKLAGDAVPLHIVGFSNGGALAFKYALEALDDPALARPDRLILVSPMIGITEFARFAGLAGLPAYFPRFARAAWIAVLPEFNPFKYNSFPVNGARQSFLVTSALQSELARHARDGTLDALPPILTFQSVIDFTVSTPAVVSTLYDQLPANGSELVLFDLNRSARFGPLLRPSAATAIERLVPPPPRRYGLTTVVDPAPLGDGMVAITEPAGSDEASEQPLGIAYPTDVFSLSHVALPFPLDDSLYGLEPAGNEDYGVNLGATAVRGERGALIVTIDSVSRMSSNPFFPYMLERIEAAIANPAPLTAP
ncbi:MAG: alpha/beta hydrolase [Geminicoccaceae bacterium]